MTKSRTSSELELLVPLRREAGAEPLHRQLEDALRTAIRDGRLAPGATLPSSRALADQLEVSRGIVVGAYEQLTAEGYLTARPGGATRVAAAAVEPAAAPVAPPSAEPAPGVVQAFEIEFRSGRPDLSLLPASGVAALRPPRPHGVARTIASATSAAAASPSCARLWPPT